MDLTNGKVAPLILKFAVPMLLGNVFQQVYFIIDSIIVGNYLGKTALAAIGASAPIMFLLVSLIIGVASGATIIISQYYGAKDMDNVKKTIDTLMVFMFFTSLIVTLAGILLSYKIFYWLKLPPESIPQAEIFFRIFMAGNILMFGYNATAAILRGMGDSKTPLYFLIISTILNIILVLFFITILKWGIAGTAAATVISQGFAFFAAVWYLNRYHSVIRFTMKNLAFDRQILRHTFRIGLPSGLQQTFVAAGMLALVRIVNNFGTDVIAAYTIVGRIDSFVSLPAMNFSMALSAFVGQNIGAGKLERVKYGLKSTLVMTTILTLVISVLIVVFANFLMGVFTKDHNVITFGVQYLYVVSFFYIFFTSMFVTNGVLRGAGATFFPMLVTLVSLWLIRVPVSYFLSEHIGVKGIWWGIPIAWFVGAVSAFLYYRTGKWKTKGVIRPVMAMNAKD